VIGRAKFNVFTVRAEELIEERPELIAVVGPLRVMPLESLDKSSQLSSHKDTRRR
jgi:hypothetical protein